MGTVQKILRSRLTPYAIMLLLMVALWLLQMDNLAVRRDNVRMELNDRVNMETIRLNDSTLAAKTTAFRLTEKEFRQSMERDQNGYSQTVAYLKQQLKDAKLKPSNLVVGVVATVTAKDTTVAKPDKDSPNNVIVDTLRYKFFAKNDSSWVTVFHDRAVKVSHYYFKPTLLITSEAKRRRSGQKHWLFPNSKLIWGKQQYYLLTVDFKNATIDKLTVIEK